MFVLDLFLHLGIIAALTIGWAALMVYYEGTGLGWMSRIGKRFGQSAEIV